MGPISKKGKEALSPLVFKGGTEEWSELGLGESLGTGHWSEKNKIAGVGKMMRHDLVLRSLMKSQSYLSVTVKLCSLCLSSLLTLKHPRCFDCIFLLRVRNSDCRKYYEIYNEFSKSYFIIY